MGLLELAVLLAWAAIVLALWAIFQLVAQNGRLLLRVEALERQLGDAVGLAFPQQPQYAPAETTEEHEQEFDGEAEAESVAGIPFGTVLHDFELPDLDGRQYLRSAWLGKRMVMLFVSPYCQHSRALLADLAKLPARSSSQPPLLIISTGSIDENRRLVERTGLTDTLLIQEEMEVGALFQVTGTPMAYLVDEDGRTASVLAAGRAAVLGLIVTSDADGDLSAHLDPPSVALIEAATTPAPVNGARYQGGIEVGSQAPDFDVPGLDGHTVALDRFRGERVLIVFTDPIGPPCDEILPALEDADRSPSGPKVVLIAHGGLEENRAWAEAHRLTLPIGVQHRWDVSREYGLLAAPIAFLVSEQGMIAAPVAVGADAILDLCGEGALAEQHGAMV